MSPPRLREGASGSEGRRLDGIHKIHAKGFVAEILAKRLRAYTPRSAPRAKIRSASPGRAEVPETGVPGNTRHGFWRVSCNAFQAQPGAAA